MCYCDALLLTIQTKEKNTMKKIITYSFDIQLFADAQTQPVNYTGSPTLAPENKEYYDKRLIRFAMPKLVFGQFGQKRNVPAKAGQKITFRSFASLGKQTTPLIEGVTPDSQTLSVTEIEAKVNQYGGYVELTDVLDLTAIDPVISETVRLIGDQAGLSMDTVVRDILNTGTNVAYTVSVGADGTETENFYRFDIDETSKLTVQEVEKNVTELRSQNAPTFDGYYIAIVHPKAIYDLMRDSDWRKAQQYTDQVTKIYKGEVGEIGGCRFVITTEAKVIKGADLASDSRNLAVNGAANGGTSVNFDGGTVEVNALKDRFILIDGKRYKVLSNTASAITVDGPVTCADNTVIYPGEGGKNGCAVFCTLMFGQDAFGTTEIEGGGLETIIKPKGSAGTADPLDQRSTVGWKGMITAEILVEQYIRRIESGGTYAQTIAAN